MSDDPFDDTSSEDTPDDEQELRWFLAVRQAFRSGFMRLTDKVRRGDE